MTTQTLRTLLFSTLFVALPATAQSLPKNQNIDPEDTRVVVPDRVDTPVVATPESALFIPSWTVEQATELLRAIEGVGALGLNPADYEPVRLAEAITAGPGHDLDRMATGQFARLATHLRDGRTPNSARKQWFVNDTDAAAAPMADLLTRALSDGVAPTLGTLEPVHPAYAALKSELARVPAKDKARADRIRVNMERWRWMPRDLGPHYILSNVPEMYTYVVENGVTLARHKAVVGKPETATPQLDARATAIILNPPWNLPRSIINEGIGNLIARNPAAARRQGYTWTGTGKNLWVTQQPGKGNALGVMKLEMLNEHAIYLHDTPSKAAFAADVRAFSHGCIRTERALHFSGLMAVRYGATTPEDFGAAMASGKTTRIEFANPFPVYVTYWTMMPGADGKMTAYKDLYDRDAPVIASFAEAGRVAEMPLLASAKPAAPTPAGRR